MQQVARRKLRMLNNAQSLPDLRIPPGNRLEALKGDRTGEFSIRVNDQYRITVTYREEVFYEVSCADYHSR